MVKGVLCARCTMLVIAHIPCCTVTWWIISSFTEVWQASLWTPQLFQLNLLYLQHTKTLRTINMLLCLNIYYSFSICRSLEKSKSKSCSSHRLKLLQPGIKHGALQRVLGEKKYACTSHFSNENKDFSMTSLLTKQAWGKKKYGLWWEAHIFHVVTVLFHCVFGQFNCFFTVYGKCGWG